MKRYVDLNGNSLIHGDKVLTVLKNGRAKGGDLVEAYFKQVDVNKSAILVFNMNQMYTSYGLYKIISPSKVFKLP